MDTKQKELQIAKEIVELSAGALITELRALSYAIKALEFRADETVDTIGTDGSVLLYSPSDVIGKFSKNKEIVARELLHAILHCVFRHVYRGHRKNRVLWDIACDISVENAILGSGLSFARDRNDASKRNALKNLGAEAGTITAENLYFYFMETRVSPQFYRDLLLVDSHELWYRNCGGSGGEDAYSANGETPSIYKAADDRPSNGTDEPERTSGDNGDRRENEKEKWEQIGRRIAEQLDLLSSECGRSSGNLITELAVIDRERYRYTDILRLFAETRETKEINLDEFDYIYYTYGLTLYKNMPLVEPLEQKETRTIGDLFIAIDTSGSVRGEKVRSFIEATFSILKKETSFSSETNIHLLQCDAAVRNDSMIRSLRELEKYMDDLELQGFGGTDFRAAFRYADELLRRRAIRHVNGLIYFTDGDGIYPEEPPAYKTAFILTDGKNIGKVPKWSLKMVLGRERLEAV